MITWLHVALVMACVFTPALASAHELGEPTGLTAFDAFEREFVAQRWSIDEGLPQVSATDVVQSSDGYLWVTTFGGIARFDGYEFQIFDLSNSPTLETNRFLSALEGADGQMWFGAESGELVRFDGETFHTIIGLGVDFEASARAMALDANDELWCATHAGVFVVRDDTPERIIDADANALLWREQVLWVGAVDGLLRWEGGRAQAVVFEDGAPVGSVLSIFEDDGQLWVGTASGVVVVRDGVAYRTPFAGDGPGFVTKAIARDGEGRLWFATMRGLFVVRDPEEPEGIAPVAVAPVAQNEHPGVRALMRDREGNLWIGTDRLGLVRVQPREIFVVPTQVDSAPLSVTSIAPDREGGHWMSAGCAYLFHEQHNMIDAVHYVGANGAGCIGPLLPRAEGGVWFGTSDNVGWFDGEHLELSALPSRLDAPVSAFLLEDDRLWIGTRRSLWSFDLDSKALEQHDLGAVMVTSLARRPGGSLWIGTNGGLHELRGDGEMRRWFEQPGLARGALRALTFDDEGALWIGSYGGGLSRMRQPGTFKLITMKDGLYEDTISSIIIDRYGFVWMHGNRGVSKVSLDDLRSFADGRTDQVVARAYQSGEGNGGVQPSALVDDDGVMWFATVAGAATISPEPGENHTAAPMTHLVEATLEGVDLLAGGDRRVLYQWGDLEVAFVGVGLTNPSTVRYRYRLLGSKADDWIDTGTRREVHVANLSPGKYRLEVISSFSEGRWSGEPEVLEFELLPRFYQTIWFYLVTCVLAVLALALAHIWRLRRLSVFNVELQHEVLERKRVEERLRRGEQQYRQLFESSVNGFCIVTERGQVVMSNSAFQIIFELDREPDRLELIELFPERERGHLGDILRSVMSEEDRFDEIQAVRGEDEVLDLQISATMCDFRGAPHALFTIHDISAHKRAAREKRALEHQLERAKRIETLGRLAGGISHDFNNILTAISGNVELLKMDLEDDEVIEPYREYLDELDECCTRAASLSGQLLSFGRADLNSPDLVDLNQCVANMESMLRRLLIEDIELVLALDADLGSIFADATQVEQIILNLVINAGDAMPVGGVLRIVTSRVARGATSDDHVVSGDGPWTHVRLVVEDSGQGIPEEHLGKIFEPFFTTKDASKGTGLGLATVQAIVAQAAGELDVSSVVGQGTTITIDFPIARSIARSDASNERMVTPGGDELILLCDDEDAVRRPLARLLRYHGYEVLEAGGAEAAVELALEHRDSLCALVSDVIMPRMNGMQLYEKISAELPDLAVLFISGYTGDVLLSRGVIEGEIPLIYKPINSTILLRRLRERLDAVGCRNDQPLGPSHPG